MPLEPGTTLGPYRVTAKIGEGGMGEVYLARDTKLDRDVALKVLPQAFTDDPNRLARFEREANANGVDAHRNPILSKRCRSSRFKPVEWAPGPFAANRDDWTANGSRIDFDGPDPPNGYLRVPPFADHWSIRLNGAVV